MIPIVKSWLIGMAGLLLLAAPLQQAQAASPKTIKVNKTVLIAAEPAAVWDRIKDFNGLHTWHPGFTNAEIVKGSNNQVGAVRKLTLKDGPSFTEDLLVYSAAKHTMRYHIIESPLPVQVYVSSITVTPGKSKGTSLVTWHGSFKRKKADNPGPDETDAAVTKLITGVYEAGLGNLKKLAESK